MPKSYLLAAKCEQGVRTTQTRYATVAEALTSAGELLRHGAPAVSIIDSENNLILPADQVRRRVNGGAAHQGPA
jgi:hypothetical protein